MKIKTIILWIMILALYGSLACQYEKFSKYLHTVCLQMEGKEFLLDGKQAAELHRQNESKEEGMAFAVWKQTEKESVENTDLRRVVETSVIAVCGRTDLLFETDHVLDLGDSSQCLIGEQTALKLFGGVNIAGLSVSYQGKLYNIVDVLYGAPDIFVYEASDESVKELNRITVKKGPGESTRVVKQRFESTFFISGELIEYELGILFLQLGFVTIPLVLVLRMVIKINSYSKRKERKVFWKIAYYAISAVLVGVCFILIASELYIPPDYIPTVWSDQIFWSALAKEWKENIMYLLSVKKCIPDLLFVEGFFHSLCLYFAMGIAVSLKSMAK